MKKNISKLLIISILVATVFFDTNISYAKHNSTKNSCNALFGWDDGWGDDWGNDWGDDWGDPTPTKEPIVTPAPTPNMEPTLNKSTLELTKKKTYKLKVKNFTGKVKFQSSNKKVATVTSSGLVKAKKAGKATIYAKCSTVGLSLKCKLTVYSGITPQKAYKKIMALKSTYKEGKRWTNSNYYFWKAIYCQCYGCIAFAGKISDKVFGKKAKVKKHHSFAKIKAGDHIRVGDYHSVVALKKSGNKITVVEGNYNNSIHWGRKISKSELNQDGFYVETRY